MDPVTCRRKLVNRIRPPGSETGLNKVNVAGVLCQCRRLPGAADPVRHATVPDAVA